MLRQPKPDQPSKLQVKYRVKPLQVMKVLPGDTYRVAETGVKSTPPLLMFLSRSPGRYFSKMRTMYHPNPRQRTRMQC